MLTGGIGPAEREIAELIQQPAVSMIECVRTGRIDTRATRYDAGPRVVRSCFPRLYEGFGLPVIEALRVGCPPIVADATALPEAVGGAGVLVDAVVRRRLASTRSTTALSWDGADS